MLDALVANELTDVCAVVVRYFGGVLLGAGGLTRAYRASVAETILEARILQREPRQDCAVTLGYAEAGALEAEARSRGWGLGEASYGAEVTLHVLIDPAQSDALADRVAALTAGRGVVVAGGFGFAETAITPTP